MSLATAPNHESDLPLLFSGIIRTDVEWSEEFRDFSEKFEQEICQKFTILKDAFYQESLRSLRGKFSYSEESFLIVESLESLLHGSNSQLTYNLLDLVLNFVRSENFKTTNIITKNWITDSIHSNKLLPLEKYFLDFSFISQELGILLGNKNFYLEKDDLGLNGVLLELKAARMVI